MLSETCGCYNVNVKLWNDIAVIREFYSRLLSVRNNTGQLCKHKIQEGCVSVLRMCLLLENWCNCDFSVWLRIMIFRYLALCSSWKVSLFWIWFSNYFRFVTWYSLIQNLADSKLHREKMLLECWMIINEVSLLIEELIFEFLYYCLYELFPLSVAFIHITDFCWWLFWMSGLFICGLNWRDRRAL